MFQYSIVVFETRKLSYRKDDRAMRPIYVCPENFWECPTILTATFSKKLPKNRNQKLIGN